MINLAKVKLPDCIEASGSFYKIQTDFRSWLNFSRIVNTKEAVVDDVDFIYTDIIRIPSFRIFIAALTSLSWCAPQ